MRGRPRTVIDPQMRTLALTAEEWSWIRAAGGASWTERVRAAIAESNPVHGASRQPPKGRLIARTIRLGAAEWARLERLLPHCYWADRVRCCL